MLRSDVTFHDLGAALRQQTCLVAAFRPDQQPHANGRFREQGFDNELTQSAYSADNRNRLLR